MVFPEPTGDNLILPESLPSLTDLSIDEIFGNTHFTLPKTEKLKRLSLGQVDSSGSFRVTRELHNLETLIIKKLNTNA